MSSAAPPTDGRRECALLRAVLDRNPDAIAKAVHSTAAVVPSRELPGSNGAPPTSVDIDGFSCVTSTVSFISAVPSTMNAAVGVC